MFSSGSKIPVLISGSGVGGLTASLALHRAGYTCSLITREKSFGAGYRNVVIGGKAVRILDRLGLGHLLRSHGTPITNGSIENERGMEVFKIDTASLGTEVWILPRSHLQQFFVESLPPESVTFNTRLRSIDAHPSNDSVKVEMLHSPPNEFKRPGYPTSRSPTTRINAGLVIGADGLASAVRTSISGHMVTTSYSCFWHGVTKTTDMDLYKPNSFRELWASSNDTIPTRFGFARLTSDEVAWWAVAPNAQQVGNSNGSPGIYLRPFQSKLVNLFRDFPDFVSHLIRNVQNDREIHRRQLREAWNESPVWIDHSSNRIALVGEAGRAGELGALHHGCSFAIADSYTLINKIAEQGGPESSRLPIALRAYEQDRLAHGTMAKTHAMEFRKISYSSSITRALRSQRFLSSLQNETIRELQDAV